MGSVRFQFRIRRLELILDLTQALGDVLRRVLLVAAVWLLGGISASYTGWVRVERVE